MAASSSLILTKMTGAISRALINGQPKAMLMGQSRRMGETHLPSSCGSVTIQQQAEASESAQLIAGAP